MNIEQWRSQCGNCRYPFNESSTLTNAGIEIPEGFLVDTQIFLLPSQGRQAYLSSLTLVGDNIIGNISSEQNTLIGSFTIQAANLNSGNAPILSANGLSVGVVVFGDQASVIFQNLPLGQTSFQISQTLFEASCVFPRPECVTNILVAGTAYPGKIALVEGPGINLVKLDDQTVRIDALGASANLDACCDQTGLAGLKTINEIPPDSFGSWSIQLLPFSEPGVATDLRQVLRITTTANGLIFSLAKSS